MFLKSQTLGKQTRKLQPGKKLEDRLWLGQFQEVVTFVLHNTVALCDNDAEGGLFFFFF